MEDAIRIVVFILQLKIKHYNFLLKNNNPLWTGRGDLHREEDESMSKAERDGF